MTPPATVSGLLSRNLAPTRRGNCATIDLDLEEHLFLRDHLVGGQPLLSTVMGIESMACAAALIAPDRGSPGLRSVTDVAVLPPYFLPTGQPGRVQVTVLPDRGSRELRCELSGPGSDSGWAPPTVHFRGTFPDQREVLLRPISESLPAKMPGGPAAGAELIYRLFFHGPSFRVVESVHFSAGLMVGVAALGLPPVVHPHRRSLMAPLLIELCLQTAGLWELAVLGRMMIPHSIERVTRFTAVDLDDGVPLFALVSPRVDVDGRAIFDARVIDREGQVHLEVTGYRSVEFGHPTDQAAAEPIRQALSGIPGAI